ncbi:GIY-YIG nuclease family protein [Methylovulum miyakonense]|uniref:GIY-YIG nuclease family protein n=1 Tax=Methylovulum miyakonense TaxID=645578 RepID=UPI0003646D0D|nr:GIY-YIG nuclease family protein [Methylovulum miyakonense]
MAIDKQKIISEIIRTAKENGGIALGMTRFEQETGIRKSDWEAKYWTKWSDALIEAGYSPNQFGAPACDKELVLVKLAELTRVFGHYPNKNEIKMRKRGDSSIPTDVTIRRLFGNKYSAVNVLLSFVKNDPVWSDLIETLENELERIMPESNVVADDTLKIGYVYLMQHGNRNEYKIGYTYDAIRREGEIKIQLPERVNPIHYIETDDPSGIEAYWHRRFSQKRKNGEWFELSKLDVRAFKRWRKIY